MKEILPTNVIEYIERLKKKDAHTRQVFEKNLDFIIAMKTEIGKELLADLIDRHEHIFMRIAALTASDSEKETYLYLNGMLRKWSTRIADYEKQLISFKEEMTERKMKGDKK